MFDHLNQMRPKKTVYEIVYEQKGRRPAYSYNIILGYREVHVLVFFATIQETATQLCLTLSDPASYAVQYPFASWIEGSAVGLIVIAIFHPFLFHKSMVFIPTAIFLFLQILFYLGILIAEIFKANGNS